MNDNNDNFFNRLKSEEHRGFEITMFSVSVCVAVVMLISIIMVMVYWHRANAERITDEEVNATNVTVTESAVSVTVTEKPYDIASGGAVVSGNEEDFEDDEVDEKLKNAEYAYTTATVNLRSDSSLTASVVMKVASGERVKVMELSEDNKWMKVSYDGQSGYINVMYLTATKPVATATPERSYATATPYRTQAPVVTATPKPKKTATPKPKKTAKPTKEPEDDEDEPEDDDEEPTEAPATEAPTAVPATAAPTEKPATPAPTEVPVTEAPATDNSDSGETQEE